MTYLRYTRCGDAAANTAAPANALNVASPQTQRTYKDKQLRLHGMDHFNFMTLWGDLFDPYMRKGDLQVLFFVYGKEPRQMQMSIPACDTNVSDQQRDEIYVCTCVVGLAICVAIDDDVRMGRISIPWYSVPGSCKSAFVLHYKGGHVDSFDWDFDIRPERERDDAGDEEGMRPMLLISFATTMTCFFSSLHEVIHELR